MPFSDFKMSLLALCLGETPFEIIGSLCEYGDLPGAGGTLWASKHGILNGHEIMWVVGSFHRLKESPVIL